MSSRIIAVGFGYMLTNRPESLLAEGNLLREIPLLVPASINHYLSESLSDGSPKIEVISPEDSPQPTPDLAAGACLVI